MIHYFPTNVMIRSSMDCFSVRTWGKQPPRSGHQRTWFASWVNPANESVCTVYVRTIEVTEKSRSSRSKGRDQKKYFILVGGQAILRTSPKKAAQAASKNVSKIWSDRPRLFSWLGWNNEQIKKQRHQIGQPTTWEKKNFFMMEWESYWK